jgi:hypothetical protein
MLIIEVPFTGKCRSRFLGELPSNAKVQLANNKSSKRARPARKQSGQTEPKTPMGPIHKFRRWVGFSTWGSTALTTSYYATSFSLSGVPGYTEFTALYDQYRITKVNLHLWPTNIAVTNSNSGSTIVNLAPRVVTAIDYDDSTNAGSFNELREYSTAEVHIVTDKVVRTFSPAVSTVVYEGVSSSGYAPTWGQWISTNDPSVPHYGMKGAIEATGSSSVDSAYGYRVEAEYFLEFRASK